MVDGGEHRPLVDKFHHRLGGVDIDVNHVEGQVNVEYAAGEPAFHLPVGVGLLQGGGEQGGLDDAPAAEKGLHGPAAPARQGFGDIAPDGYVLAASLHLPEAQGEVTAPDGVDGGEKFAVAGGVEFLLSVPEEADGDLRMAQGDLGNETGGGGALGAVALHEFQPGGSVEKQVPDSKGGALRTARRFHRAGNAALQAEGSALRGPLLPGEHVQPADGGDGRQGLPPEAQGADGRQIPGGAHLAGGMAEKGGGQLPGSDAAAVIRHPDEGHAAVLQIRHHGGRPGVYGVLDQLLDDAGGALYDLPGGDEVRYVGGKLLNMGHSLPFFPVESGSLPYSITKFGVVCKRRVAGGSECVYKV